MKFRTTKKEINNGYTNRICVGYCALQTLLSFENPVAYTTRTEGWGADIYLFGTTAIITGYAPFGNIRPDYELCKKYERFAEGKSKEEKRKLIDEFIKEVCNV